MFTGKRRTACTKCAIQLEPVQHLIDVAVGKHGQCSCQEWLFRINPGKPDAPPYCKHILAARQTLSQLLLETYIRQYQASQQRPG
jgi:hypothetical protein